MGNYGTVYQDYATDAALGLSMAAEELRPFRKLNVIISQSSLYHAYACQSISDFCKANKISCVFHSNVSPRIVHAGEVYLIVNGQLDMDLINLVRVARAKNLKPGKDFRIIVYNDSPIREIVLDGLTTISTDFEQMGRLAAEMILDNTPRKVKCDFRMIRRGTF